jgi:hypothetical protein
MKTRNDLARLRRAPVLRSVVATVAAMSLLVSGCVSMQNVPLPEGGRPPQTMAVKTGDKVEVETRSGKLLSFTVTAVEPDALVGKIEPTGTELKLGIRDATGTEVRVGYEDIISLQVQHVDVARTVRAGLETVGVVLLVAVLIVVEALAGCQGSLSWGS